MAAGTKYQAFVENLAEKVHNLGADTLKLMATNAAPTATNSVKADLTEISAGNGYTAGGTTVSVTSSAQSSGTYTLSASQVVYTASGGSIGPLRTVHLYNDTPTSPADPLICAWDNGSSITLADGETLTVKFNNANPGAVLTLL